MENTFIQNVSNETIAAIEKISAKNLPDRPTAQGMRPDDIKKAFYEPILNASYSAVAEIDRVIKAINDILGAVSDLDEIPNGKGSYPAQAQAVKEYVDGLGETVNSNKTLLEEADKELGDRLSTAEDEIDDLQAARAGENVFGMVKSGGDMVAENGVLSIGSGKVTTTKLADNAVTADKIKDGEVTEDKIKDGAVTEDKINTGAVTTNKIQDGAVTTNKIQDNAVTEDKINNGAVTRNKLATGAICEHKLDPVLLGRIQSLEKGAFKDVSYNAPDGVLTFVSTNGVETKVDLPLELIVSGGYYDETEGDEAVVLELANGSEIRIAVDDMLRGLMDYINGIKNSIYTLQKAPPLRAFGTAVLLNTPTIAQLAVLRTQEVK